MTKPSVRSLRVSAQSYVASGQIRRAKHVCEEARRYFPLNPALLLVRARIWLAQGAAAAAVQQLLAATKNGNTSVEECLLLSHAYVNSGEIERAEYWAGMAMETGDSSAQSYLWLGLCCLEREHCDKAATHLLKAIEVEPDFAAAHFQLGRALKGLGRLADAANRFESSIEYDGNVPDAYAELITVLLALGHVEKAATFAQRFSEKWPDSAANYLLQAQVRVTDGQGADGAALARQAVELAPMDGKAQACLGALLLITGETGDAIESSAKSVELEPCQGSAYLNLARARRYTADDRDLILRMERLLNASVLGSDQGNLLAYAVAKTLEDIGDFEASAKYYDIANQLAYFSKFGERRYDMSLNHERFEGIKRAFSGEFLREHVNQGSASKRPIFVVGMIRSGTTLMEQILASHPQVGGAGELRFWPMNRHAAFDQETGLFDSEALRNLADDYCRLLEETVPGKRHVVDKLPGNYMQLGLLHLAFPHAKVIHMMRNPADTCFSIYATQNSVWVPWCHERANIVANYERYTDLMRHWGRTLPNSNVHHVQYEELVSQPEVVVRSVLEHCELEWQDACLYPEQTQREVRTPSLCQVRQPINKGSVARCLNFSSWMPEFARLVAK